MLIQLHIVVLIETQQMLVPPLQPLHLLLRLLQLLNRSQLTHQCLNLKPIDVLGVDHGFALFELLHHVVVHELLLLLLLHPADVLLKRYFFEGCAPLFEGLLSLGYTFVNDVGS